MNKCIFHGGGSTRDEVGSNTFFHELVEDVPEKGTILLVYFASREDDNSDRIAYDSEKCRNATTKNLDIIVANEAEFEGQVLKADAIYFRGGSTEKLIATLKNYSNLKQILKNKQKTIAGCSAGAYALSTYFSSHYEDMAASGLGIVPIRVVTHYESGNMPPKAGAIEKLKETATELPLIILKESEWKVFHSK